jgi:hypothetical protein
VRDSRCDALNFVFLEVTETQQNDPIPDRYPSRRSAVQTDLTASALKGARFATSTIVDVHNDNWLKAGIVIRAQQSDIDTQRTDVVQVGLGVGLYIYANDDGPT